MKRVSFMWAFFASILLVAITSSCGDPPPPGAPADLVLFLDPGYLGDCDASLTTESNLEIMIGVDQLNPDGTFSNVILDVYDLNNDSQGNPANLEFEVVAPSTGIFIVTVSIEITCNVCCGSFGKCIGASQGGMGNPIYRAVSGQYNGEAPPSLIQLTPVFNQCIRCGC